MEFYQLEAFVAVAALRSFSRAAEHLYLSQPTVSSHVKTLEKELNTLLFDRGKNELMLTQAGETLYRYARNMLEMRAAVLAELSVEKVKDELLMIAASSVPCQYLLPEAIALFQEQYSSVNIRLCQENSRTVCEEVFRYNYPLGVVGEKVTIPQLKYEPLVEDELVLAIPQLPAYADLLAKEELTLQDLTSYKLLLREAGSGTRSLFEQELQRLGFSIKSFQLQIFDNQETIKQAVRSGLGITIISRTVVEDYLQFNLLAVRSLQELQLKRKFYLVTHAKRIQTPGAKAFIAFLRTHFSTGGQL